MARHDPPTHHRGNVKKCQKSRRSLIDPLAFHWGGIYSEVASEFKIQIQTPRSEVQLSEGDHANPWMPLLCRSDLDCL